MGVILLESEPGWDGDGRGILLDKDELICCSGSVRICSGSTKGTVSGLIDASAAIMNGNSVLGWVWFGFPIEGYEVSR